MEDHTVPGILQFGFHSHTTALLAGARTVTHDYETASPPLPPPPCPSLSRHILAMHALVRRFKDT